MVNFSFYLPTRFVFGKGEIEKTGEEAKKLGGKALLVTGRNTMRRTGILDRVLELMRLSECDVVLFEGIEPNAKVGQIEEAAGICKAEKCEFVIGLGGGSVMDAVKGIAICSTHPGSIWEYVTSFQEFREVTDATLPIMEIPTVAGTGSEGNGITVIANEANHQKAVIKSQYIFPKVSIIDPELTLSLPPRLTAACGVDIACHLLEPYLTRSLDFAPSIRICEGIIKVVVENLPVAVRDAGNYRARENLSWAATLACSPLRNLGLSGGGSLHHIQHSAGGWYDVSHGEALCALLPAWLEHIKEDIRDKLSEFGLQVFGKKDAIGAVRSWLKELGMDIRLSELGIRKDTFAKMALDTIKVYGKGESFLPFGAVKISSDDIIEIYENAG